jgi:phosphatidylserine/phosphatidylglycerophosphate/cardiolipin synthase-like enzyme
MLGLLIGLLAAAAPDVRVITTNPEQSGPGRQSALESLVECFDRAESTIDIAEMYMLYYPPESKGSALYPLYDALIAAAQRGVRVRILLDSVTLETGRGETYQRMRRALDRVPGIAVRACDLRPRSRYEGCMMHAKYLVVDAGTAVIGSHNWSFAGFFDNVELSLAVPDTGLAAELGRVFEQDWSGEDSRSPGVRDSGEAADRLRLVVTAPAGRQGSGELSTHEALQRVFAAADSTLDVIVNSISDRVEFGADRRYCFIDSLFRAASGRGVRVRLLVDKWAREHDSLLLVSLDSLANVAVRVADISAAGPNLRTGSVHAKAVIADRRTVLVGSATLSQRQIEECRNVGVLLSDTATAAELTGIFERIWFSTFTREQ